MSEDLQIQLISEQLKRIQDNQEARFKRLEVQVNYNQQFSAEKELHLKKLIEDLQLHYDDHELRIRAAHDDAVSFRTWSNIFNGGAIFTAAAAFIKAAFSK